MENTYGTGEAESNSDGVPLKYKVIYKSFLDYIILGMVMNQNDKLLTKQRTLPIHMAFSYEDEKLKLISTNTNRFINKYFNVVYSQLGLN